MRLTNRALARTLSGIGLWKSLEVFFGLGHGLGLGLKSIKFFQLELPNRTVWHKIEIKTEITVETVTETVTETDFAFSNYLSSSF